MGRNITASISYFWEDEVGLRDLTFDIEGTLSPYDPGCTYGPPESCYPPEGGELEDWTICLTNAEIFDQTGNVVRRFTDLTAVERVAIENELDRLMREGGDRFDDIDTRLREEAGSMVEDYD